MKEYLELLLVLHAQSTLFAVCVDISYALYKSSHRAISYPTTVGARHDGANDVEMRQRWQVRKGETVLLQRDNQLAVGDTRAKRDSLRGLVDLNIGERRGAYLDTVSVGDVIKRVCGTNYLDLALSVGFDDLGELVNGRWLLEVQGGELNVV